MKILDEVKKQAEAYCSSKEITGTKDQSLNDYGKQACIVGVRKTISILSDSQKYKLQRVE